MPTEQLPPLAPDSRVTPQQVTPARLEQIIDRIGARYLTDLRALREELSQPVQTTEREREPLAVLPNAGAPPQNIQQAQVETSRFGVPAPVAPPPVRPQHRTGAERLEARTVHPFYWALLYGVATLISLGLGILLPIIIRL